MILYLECANGVSGDMLTAALLELVRQEQGGDPLAETVRPALTAVGLDPGLATSTEVRRGGVVARAFTVLPAEGFATFTRLIDAVERAGLSEPVTDAVVAVARHMAAAEQRVHGDRDEHLHELSDADTVIDLLAVALLIERLMPTAVVASAPALGGGMVQTAHGLVPVPAPAVLELLQGRPTAGATAGDGPGELTTPTGAALLAYFAAPVAGLPAGVIRRVACGAGAREIPGRPNVLRAVLLERTEAAGITPSDDDPGSVLIETNIDDMTPELLAHAAGRLLAEGAIDVWLSDALMKKGRPGSVLHVLAPDHESRRLAELIFAETSTFGLRVLPVRRIRSGDRRVSVDVEGCVVRVRLGYAGGRLATVSPEYEDVRAAATALGRTARDVYEAAQRAARDDAAGWR